MIVLVADDDRTIRIPVESVPKQSGYQVITATDGEEAWEIMQGNNAPRMAVLDWEMPGMSGPELCRHSSNLKTMLRPISRRYTTQGCGQWT